MDREGGVMPCAAVLFPGLPVGGCDYVGGRIRGLGAGVGGGVGSGSGVVVIILELGAEYGEHVVHGLLLEVGLVDEVLARGC